MDDTQSEHTPYVGSTKAATGPVKKGGKPPKKPAKKGKKPKKKPAKKKKAKKEDELESISSESEEQQQEESPSISQDEPSQYIQGQNVDVSYGETMAATQKDTNTDRFIDARKVKFADNVVN